MPSGKPGKFSTSVVVVSCGAAASGHVARNAAAAFACGRARQRTWPPGAMPLAIQPSNMIGLSIARAA
jgi:hypothetical protein